MSRSGGSSKPRRALILRMSAYSLTPAGPRTAATLQEMGYEVDILALDRTKQAPRREIVQGWRIIRMRADYKAGGKASFLWMWVRWWAWVMYRLMARRYDLVHAMNLESIVPCVWLKWLRRYKLIYDIRDPWGMTLSNRRLLSMRILTWLDRRMSARCSGILLSQGVLDRTGRYFGSKTRRGVPAIQVLNVPRADRAGGFDPPATDGVRLNFSGWISYMRNARAVIELAKARPNVRIDVIGDIADDELRTRLEGVENIALYGRCPFERAMELMREANLVSIMYDVGAEVAIVSSANKMFESMMMSRPYIASAGGFPGMVAEGFGLGWTVPYDDEHALIDLVDDLAANPAKIVEAARVGRQTYVENFTWPKQKDNLVQLVRHLADGEEVTYHAQDGWRRLVGVTYDMGNSDA